MMRTMPVSLLLMVACGDSETTLDLVQSECVVAAFERNEPDARVHVTGRRHCDGYAYGATIEGEKADRAITGYVCCTGCTCKGYWHVCGAVEGERCSR